MLVGILVAYPRVWSLGGKGSSIIQIFIKRSVRIPWQENSAIKFWMSDSKSAGPITGGVSYRFDGVAAPLALSRPLPASPCPTMFDYFFPFLVSN